MDRATAQANLNAARALAAARNYAGAIAKLRIVLNETPDDAETLALLAFYELQQGHLAQADEAARAALAAKPDYSFAHRLRGDICRRRRDTAGAEVNFRKAIELEPDEAYNHLQLSRLLASVGRLDEAESGYRTAMELQPADGLILSSYADLLVAKRRFDEAEDMAGRALKVMPEQEDVLFTNGDVAYHRGDLDRATDFAMWALRIDPSDYRALDLLAKTKLRRNAIIGVFWQLAVWLNKSSWRFYVVFGLGGAGLAALRDAFFPWVSGAAVRFALVAFVFLVVLFPWILRWRIERALRQVRMKTDF